MAYQYPPDTNAYSSGAPYGQQQQQQQPPRPAFSPPPVIYHTQTPPPPPPPPAPHPAQQQQQQQQPSQQQQQQAGSLYTSNYADPYAPRQTTPSNSIGAYTSSVSNHGAGWASPPPPPVPGTSSSPGYGAQSHVAPTFAAFPPPSGTPHPFAHASSPPPGGVMGPRVRYDSNASSLAAASAVAPSASNYLLQQSRPPLDSWHPSAASGRASFDDGDDVRLLPRTGSNSAYAPMPGGFDLSDPAPSHHPLYAPSLSDQNDSDDDDFGANGGAGGSASSRQMHYGPVPSRVPRRNKTVRKVELFMGHLVLDCPVPKRLLDSVRERDGNEFGVMRYTAVTCDPDMFKADRYALRQILYPETRKTELFIVLTMYNEDDELFLRTLRGVMQNIDYLCTKSKSRTWNDKGWQKVVVCIVSDGRQKIHPRTLACIQKLGCYQPGPAKNVVNGKAVTAHVYEYTTQLRVNSKLQIVPGNADSVPVQLLFCLKERNQKKLNSHRWFFNAFGQVLVPNVCVLIDVGTQPGPHSIYHLWKSFDLNSEVGGACGEIVALKGRYWSTLAKNPLVAAQNFEYKMSNILDKPLESVFGFISVLPGAFSAYRYIALQNDPQTGEGPLQKYFLGETMHGADAGIFDANMYLAEDRILCWELVSKKDSSWHLHYVKSAYGITDVPDTIPDLVSQRRRWLNGSFFASLHATFHFYYLYRSRHSATRKFFLHILILYQAIQLVFSWFAIGNYFIAFYVLTQSMESFTPALKWLNLILTYVYAGLTMACFIMALGNRPKGSKWGYSMAFVTFAIITVYMTFAAFWIAFKSIKTMQAAGASTVKSLMSNLAFVQIVLSILATFGIYVLASLIHYDPWHMVTSLVQYLLIAPSYISVMNVYAFCNTHDVSWGTKGQDKVATDLGVVTSGKSDGNKDTAEVNVTEDTQDLDAEYDDAAKILAAPKPKVVERVSPEDAQEDYYKAFRTRLLLAWVLSNGFLVAIVLTASSTFSTTYTDTGDVQQSTSIYLTIVLYCVVVLALFRFIGSVAYIVVRMFIGE